MFGRDLANSRFDPNVEQPTRTYGPVPSWRDRQRKGSDNAGEVRKLFGAREPLFDSVGALESLKTAKMIVLRMRIVPILYRELVFEAFGDFNDFAESLSYGTSKTCQDRD